MSPYPFPITGAKIHSPLLRSDTLSRPRLTDWLDRAAAGRVALIVAEAGFGKTTLLADWASRTPRRIAWYRLEPDDKDWLVFLRHLVAAGRELDPDFAADSLELILALGAGGPKQEDIVTALVREYGEFAASLPDGLTLILDDHHVIDGSPETDAILRALIERTGNGFSIVIASRAAPKVPLGRLRARGGLMRIEGEDLCFDVPETDRLFREAYHRPLEPDIIAELIKRTEGWAALLTLVRTSLEDKDAPEARALVAQLSATRGDLYDFLAEEVLETLSPSQQHFLTRVSVLVSVDAETGSLVDGRPAAELAPLIAEAETLGLLTRPDRESPHRFHPLVRDFLVARLREEVGDAQVREMHSRVAEALERRDWLRSAWHYRAAERVGDAERVIDAAVGEIIATGTFELAAQFLDGSAGSVGRPGALILLSRLEFGRGQLSAALGLARSAIERASGAKVRGTALLNLAGLQGVAGYSDDGVALAREALNADLSAAERAIAQTIVSLRTLADDGDLIEGAASLRQLASQQIRDGQRRYAAITLLFLSSALTWIGRTSEALDAANGASVQIVATGAGGVELVSILLARATAYLHLGLRDEADSALSQAIAASSDLTSDEVHLEVGRLFASLGARGPAELALSKVGEEDLADGYASIYASAMLSLALRRRDPADSAYRLEVLRGYATTEIASRLQLEIAAVRVALLNGLDAREAIESVAGLARKQQSRVGRVVAGLLGDTSGDHTLHSSVARIPDDLSYCISLVAEEVAHSAHRLSAAAIARVRGEVDLRPDRWREALLNEISVESPSAPACADLLFGIGSHEDAIALRAVAAKSKVLRPAALALTNKLADPVVVHDLGPVRVAVGDTTVRIVRRKVLALLCFLVTKPNMAATRDEILEALWADLTPDTAGNSLHQTIYFLRRVFEPDFREGLSARYVNYDGEIASLNPDRVSSDSRRCWKWIETGSISPDDLVELLGTYRGRFALDFAYEEWAADYRDTLHAAVLSAAEASVLRAAQAGHVDVAVHIAQRILDVDPEADAIEASLLRTYKEAGRTAAAAEQYAHYSSALRDDLGIDPPALDDV